MYVQHCFQVLQDLSRYASKVQGSYNSHYPPWFDTFPPRPPPGPPVGPAGPRPPPGPPAGPTGSTTVSSSPPRPVGRRKRSTICYFCRWPYFSGGTSSDEVFYVNTSCMYFNIKFVRLLLVETEYELEHRFRRYV